MKSSHRHHFRVAVTLIELLSVISVISLLMSVLLPSLGRAREAGRGASCAALLHQAGVALQAYTDDYEGSFFPYYEDDPDGSRRWWFGYEARGPGGSGQRDRPLDKAGGFLGPYMSGTMSDFYCAAFPYSGPGYSGKFSPPAGGYGYNTAGLAGVGTTNQPRHINQLAAKTSEIFALADGIHFDRLDYSSSPPLMQGFNEPPYIQWQNPSTFSSNAGVNGGYGHFRHLRQTNVLFVDGHVAAQPVRRPLHPFTARGLGPVANLSDESLRTQAVAHGTTTWQVDVIYGLP